MITGPNLCKAAAVVDKPGGNPLRDQFRAREKVLHEKEDKQLASAKEADRPALKQKITRDRLVRSQEYAAMICSQDAWKPKTESGTPGNVLTAFYRLVGQKARQQAKNEGHPFTLADVQKTRLTEKDIEALRKQFGDDEIKKAWPLLERHIAHEGFLTKAALKFMKSNKFMTFHAALQQAHDKMERNIDQHREKLDEQAAQDLRDHGRALEKRRLTHWTDRVVVERDQKRAQKTTYAAIGGRLIPIDTKPE